MYVRHPSRQIPLGSVSGASIAGPATAPTGSTGTVSTSGGGWAAAVRSGGYPSMCRAPPSAWSNA